MNFDASRQVDGQVFSQISRGSTLSEQVAADITQAIVDGKLQPGERMLSERDLGEQFGVSRTVIREAVRSLVAGGLVEAQSGRGLRVAEVGSGAVNRAMSMFLRRSDSINYPRVHEVRSALEIDMAGYAAERATEDDNDTLKALCDELGAVDPDDVERAAAVDVAFHRAVADATQNELFPVLLEAIAPVLLDVRLGALGSMDVRTESLDAHREIQQRIAAGDDDGARKAMRRHLDSSAKAWADEAGELSPSPGR
jgi:GntR family transcriptional regulator, transcriptional repressor for pyruvate dehydrogenase complex